MFSFDGNTVLDPFMGTGTTSVAAGRWGRNSIGVEVDPNYFSMGELRIKKAYKHCAASLITHSLRNNDWTSNEDSATPFDTSGKFVEVSRKTKAPRLVRKTRESVPP